MALAATTAGATAGPEPFASEVETVTTVTTPEPGEAAPAEAQAAKAKSKTKKLSKAAKQKAKAAKAVSVAKKQVGDPYRWGGTGPNAFDCSGLVQFSWKKAGVNLPRITHSQYARVKKKVSYKNLRPGDLLFFRGKGHVGMYVGNGKMVHSPSSGKTVRIDKLSGWRKASFSGAVRPGI
ncbi:C40 family peptidase [Spongiactinospora sp. TRM90649]|uniref:C40 family peptidase n=1 Tax=Spongiactinospora sp. TRM90649 TaxID=3031114 RepID=UPI0023F61A69|nr:C40 family peptidase [Spongiactinospora sp. TRM90649]MDF5758477.1 C40 family peptidase [Spongiactinospora sp. TRM90649]